MNQGLVNQLGAVMLLALLFVLMLALITGVAVQSATLQTRMAGNHQMGEDVTEIARALAVELTQYPENFSLGSSVGYTRCPREDVHVACDAADLTVSGWEDVGEGYEIEYRITRGDPLWWENAAYAGSQNHTANVHVGIFEIDVRVQSLVRGASARVVRGIGLAMPSDGNSPVEEDAVVVSPEETWNPYPIYWREPGVDTL